MNNAKLKKVWSVVSTILVILVVLFAMLLMGLRLFGFEVYTVISGSMRPTFREGDLIYVKHVEFSEIHIGDPITFQINENHDLATHRVMHIDKENMRFVTKGDANEIEDSPVHYNNVVGVAKFSIPLLGYVSDFIQHNNYGLVIAISVCVLVILLAFLPDIIRTFRKKPEGADDLQQERSENAEIAKELAELKEKLGANAGKAEVSPADVPEVPAGGDINEEK